MRVATHQHPFASAHSFDPNWDEQSESWPWPSWPAWWIGPNPMHEPPFEMRYQLTFELTQAYSVVIHVSADERYDLSLNGVRLGRGSERGDRQHWCYESYELQLDAGTHVLKADVWSLGELAPGAQMSEGHGFLLAAEGPLHRTLTTGLAPWQCRRLHERTFVPLERFHVNGAFFLGSFETIDASARHDSSTWSPAKPLHRAINHVTPWGQLPGYRILRPAMLPAMLEDEIDLSDAGCVRHAMTFDGKLDPKSTPHHLDEHDQTLAQAVGSCLSGQSTWTIPANTRYRVLVELPQYSCIYPSLITTGGRHGKVSLTYCEALHEPTDEALTLATIKNDRREIEGKIVTGYGDTMVLDGSEDCLFETRWWRAARYVQIMVETADEPMLIEAIRFVETRYPFEAEVPGEVGFDADDPKLIEAMPIMLRSLQMCMHETYVDCPYYEQLMYGGDTRLQALTTLALSSDSLLPEKAIHMFDLSRLPTGLTQSRYPCHTGQSIPPFGLWWVMMVEDFAMWADDPEPVEQAMPGVRATLEAMRHQIDSEMGLIAGPMGWNFVDWSEPWSADFTGVPPQGHTGYACTINLQLLLALEAKSRLETLTNEPLLAQRDLALAKQLAQSIWSHFFNPQLGMLCDDLDHQHLSQHAQSLAGLSNLYAQDDQQKLLQNMLNHQANSGTKSSPEIAKATIYFSHYLLEALYRHNFPTAFFETLDLWRKLPDQGFHTTPETPEPTRSDCHGWGAHPLYHMRASILGIRPSSPSFEHVTIRPMLGPLSYARGYCAHPKGPIHVDLTRQNDRMTGHITLPTGLTGSTKLPDLQMELRSGVNTL